MGLLSIFSNNSSQTGILSKPGDKIEGRVTDNLRKVIKVETDEGMSKYSCTEYSNGTRVETKTTRRHK